MGSYMSYIYQVDTSPQEWVDFKMYLNDHVAKILSATPGNYRNEKYLVIHDKPVKFDVFLNALPKNIRQRYNCTACRNNFKHFVRLGSITDKGKLLKFWPDISDKDGIFHKASNVVAEQLVNAHPSKFFVSPKNDFDFGLHFFEGQYRGNTYEFDRLTRRKMGLTNLLQAPEYSEENIRKSLDILKTVDNTSIEIDKLERVNKFRSTFRNLPKSFIYYITVNDNTILLDYSGVIRNFCKLILLDDIDSARRLLDSF